MRCRYNYSKDDEEIYKEFLEIANDFIPHIVKSQQGSVGDLLKDPEVFAAVLRFYDGLCSWEEGSPTPILHIGWAKPMVTTISKFDPQVRRLASGEEENSSSEEEAEEEGGKKRPLSLGGEDGAITSTPIPCSNSTSSSTNVSPLSSSSSAATPVSSSAGGISCIDHECFQKIETGSPVGQQQQATPPPPIVPENSSQSNKNFKCDLLTTGTSSSSYSNNQCHQNSNQYSTSRNVNCDRNNRTVSQQQQEENVSLSTLKRSSKRRLLELLGKECHTRLLSLPYLLGRSGAPFDEKSNPLEIYSKQPMMLKGPSSTQVPPPPANSLFVDCGISADDQPFFHVSDSAGDDKKSKPAVTTAAAAVTAVGGEKLMFASAKMKGLQELLAAEKLNVSAIQLQLTAQSQTADDSLHSRPKRSRRD